MSGVLTIATARRRHTREKSSSKIRLQAADGLLIQCPRAWRDDLAPGLSYRVHASLRADGTCYVAHPAYGIEAAHG